MGDIAVFPICAALARHRDEQSFISLYYFDIMHHKLVIHGNGYNRFHFTFFGNFPNPYVGNRHNLFPLAFQIMYLSFFSITILISSSPR